MVSFFRHFLLLFIFVGFFLPSAQAGLWAAASLPAGFTWSSSGSGAYSHDTNASTQPTGNSVQLKIPGLPPMGYSQWTIPVTSLASTAVSTESSSLKLELIDLWWDLSPDDFNFLLGYGWGYGKFDCQAADCAALNFEYKESHQFSALLGVPLGGGDFHLLAARVFAKVRVVSPTTAETQAFSGLLTGFGFRIGF